MSEQPNWHYTDSNGQQAGPVTESELKELIAQGTVPASGMAWKDGMTDWQIISQIDALQTAPTPSPAAAPTLASPAAPAAAQNPYAPPQTHVTAPITENDYPVPYVKRANYGLFVATFLIGFVVFVIGVVMLGVMSETSTSYEYSSYDEYGTTYSTSPDTEVSTAAIVTMLGGLGLLLFGGILSLIYLYRAWLVIQPGGASTTPGKAVGFLFIPLFNLYWYFIAYWKWSQDWNRVTSNHRVLSAAPRAAEGLFLTYAILNIVGMVVSLAGLASVVVYLIMMKQICSAINSMNDLHASTTNQQQGSITLR